MICSTRPNNYQIKGEPPSWEPYLKGSLFLIKNSDQFYQLQMVVLENICCRATVTSNNSKRHVLLLWIQWFLFWGGEEISSKGVCCKCFVMKDIRIIWKESTLLRSLVFWTPFEEISLNFTVLILWKGKLQRNF